MQTSKESTTLRIIVAGEGVEEQTFYRVDRATAFVEAQDLIIRRIETGRGVIRVKADGQDLGLKLRRIEAEDIEGAYELIKECASEFRPQLCWRGRTIEDMTRNGLLTGKWQGYAYFDRRGKVVAYVDSKECVDAEVTLGTVATWKPYRGQGLAAGLLFFHRLMYAASPTNSGTYEENIGMRSTFHKTGFKPRHFQDPHTGEDYVFIRDRINPEEPDNMERLTNSVYYCAPALKNGIL